MVLPADDLATRMADLARNAAGPLTVAEVLEHVTTSAVEVIPGVDLAGVLLIGKGNSVETMAPTNDLMFALDALQEKYGEGPCVEAARDELIVRIDDFEHDTQFPDYNVEVVKLRLRSALSFKLYTSQATAGALNLFSYQPNVFDAECEAVGSVLAAHAAAAILASRHGEQLQSALTSRDLIGQAKGVIMERFGVDAVRAFEMLRELSQTSNIRLVEIAQRVIDTRRS
ncbi:MAG: GAF and ANTAR domain-containing protein [Mycobacterium sp.]